jgi:hypothetical protein
MMNDPFAPFSRWSFTMRRDFPRPMPAYLKQTPEDKIRQKEYARQIKTQVHRDMAKIRRGELSPDYRDENGYLMLSRVYSYPETKPYFEQLLLRGADPDLPPWPNHGTSMLHYLASTPTAGPSFRPEIRLLLKFGADRGLKNPSGETAAQAARRQDSNYPGCKMAANGDFIDQFNGPYYSGSLPAATRISASRLVKAHRDGGAASASKGDVSKLPGS